MKTTRRLVQTVAAASVLGMALALYRGVMPLGVAGEWEWLRVKVAPRGIDLLLASLAVAAYAAFVTLGHRSLAGAPSRPRVFLWGVALAAAAPMVQAGVQSGAPVGHGLEKWVFALFEPGSSGYFSLARARVGDFSTFLAEYPEWIRGQDSLHIGTHPPGLISAEWGLLRAFLTWPKAARWVEVHAPDSVAMTLRVYSHDVALSPADRATLVATGALTLLACAGTVVPLYALGRRYLDPSSAWAAAALWPLVPSAVLFQPAADTAFPFLSALALCLALPSGLSTECCGWRAWACGAVLAVGMQFSLVFLALGLVVAVEVGLDAGRPLRNRVARVAGVGLGFLSVTLLVWAMTRANPFEVWWWNLRNHARFYTEYPRSYRAWALANPIELAVGLGLPVAAWGLATLRAPREVPRVAGATLAVLAVLTLSGKNLSEVARLWLPFFPALLVAAGRSFQRAGATPTDVGLTVALTGLQTLALQSMIQVVYPV